MQNLALWALVCLLLSSCGSHQPVPVVDIGQTPYGAKTYTVVKGDTLYSIAFRFSLDIPTLARYNHLKKPYTIYPGQRLHLNKPAIQTARYSSSKATSSSVGKSSQTKQQKSSTSKGSNKQNKGANSSGQSSAKQPTMTTSSKIKITNNDKGWLWPVKGKIIGQFSTGKKLNKGIDISVPVGTSVVSSRSGSVVYAGSKLKGYGNLIIIKHDKNYLSAYAHNRKLLVKEGDWVKQGQRIARSGDSASTKPKLHFEIRKAGKPVNPLNYLAR